MSELTELAPGLWVRSVDHTYYGLHLGTRMTIVRLPSGGLWVHSPVPLEDALRAVVTAHGPVEHVVCPNLYHHSFASPWIAAWPHARLHAPAALGKKRKDLTIDAPLSDTADPAWGGALVPVPIRGTLLQETVFVHRPSRTVVSSDLIENFRPGTGHFMTDLYLKVGGIYGRPGWSRLLRVAYRDRAAARESLSALLSHDFDRVILAHGQIIEGEAKATLREGFRFLGPLPA